jgi:lipopolysaccharide/colanic/teichoic acid biosynthesis glycosyltransferase
MPFPGRTPHVPRLEPVKQAPPPPLHEPRPRNLRLKHALDRVGAAVAIVAALPLFLVAALAAKLSAADSVLVRERRITRDGRSFHLLTFPPVPVLRRWSVDQLPQLFNIVRGEMSFVGPRPERPEFVELFGANLRRQDQPRRVRPGITGWSQLQELPGGAPLAERVRWDDWYVENWSLRLDLKIALMTVRDVCRGVHLASDG